jgi:hypothetical protein
VCPDSSLATAIEEGEVLIELPHGVIAKKSEYVWLSGLVEPDPPPGKVVKEPVKFISFPTAQSFFDKPGSLIFSAPHVM